MKDVVCMVLFVLLLPLVVPFLMVRMAWMLSGVMSEDFRDWLRDDVS